MKKVLHVLFVALLASSLSLSTSAQMADGTVVPNFQWTDLDGTTYDLYEMLDDNKIVVLDLFAVWCGPCWNYALAGGLEVFYEEYGPDGTDEVRVFAIEADPSTAAGLIEGGGNSIGDWTAVMGYPIANDDYIADILELAYYPTIYTIYPNRTITESGQASTSQHYNIASAAQIAGPAPDAAMVQYTGVKEICGGDLEVKAYLQNMSTEAMTSATITVTGALETVVEWEGSLDTYGVEEVSLGFVTMDSNQSVSITATTEGDEIASNGTLNQSLTKLSTVTGPNHIRVQVQTDNWPTETTWELSSSSGEIIDAGGPYFTTYEYFEEDYYVSAEDCYMFRIYDSFGDGLYASQYSASLEDGYYSVTMIDGDGNVEAIIGESYGADGDEFSYEVGSADISEVVSVNETELVNQFVIFPNPTNGNSNLMYTLTNSSEVSLVVYNTLGAVVLNKDFGTLSAGLQTFDLNLSGMEAGLYFVNLTANDRMVTKKVTLTK